MLTLTETAVEKLGTILDAKDMRATHGLRVFVKGGGCGGMQYGMSFDNDVQETDHVFEQHGLRVFTDSLSFNHVNGASIDYVDELLGGGFHIDNPNAISTCGCGSSFRTDESAPGSGGCGHGH